MSKEKKAKGIGIGTGMIIGIALVYILVGLAMVFVPQFKETYIIYIAGAIFVIFGIILIVKYFLTGSYRDLGKYGFSAGVLCVLIGACMLVRTQQIAVYFSLFLGICILLTAVIKLQNAVDLKSMHNKGWFVFLLIALAFLTVAVLIVLNPGGKMTQYKEVVYYILITDGVIDIISPVYLVFAIRASRRMELTGYEKKSSEHSVSDSAEKKQTDIDETDNRHKKMAKDHKNEQAQISDADIDPSENSGKALSGEKMSTENDIDDDMTKEILHFFEDEK